MVRGGDGGWGRAAGIAGDTTIARKEKTSYCILTFLVIFLITLTGVVRF
jgi:hypothetical protein